MDFQKILENNPLLYGIIGGVVIFIALLVTILTFAGKSSGGGAQEISGEPIKDDVEFVRTDNAGKAIEIQALLARNEIAASPKQHATK